MTRRYVHHEVLTFVPNEKPVYVHQEVLTFVPNEKSVATKNMNKQELLQKIQELNKKTKALKKAGSDADVALQLAQEIRALETEIAAAKVTP